MILYCTGMLYMIYVHISYIYHICSATGPWPQDQGWPQDECYPPSLSGKTVGVSGSGDVSALCCDFGRHVPRVVSALSFKLKAETSISGDRASMQWRR